MNAQAQKIRNNVRRVNRVRTMVSGTAERPRMAVFISNNHVTAQIIDDTTGKTLAYVSTVGQKIEGTMTTKAEWAGKQIAAKAKKAKISKVVLDRHGRKYHGRLKTLADAARAEGMEF